VHVQFTSIGQPQSDNRLLSLLPTVDETKTLMTVTITAPVNGLEAFLILVV
jgi:hypothetical protein